MLEHLGEVMANEMVRSAVETTCKDKRVWIDTDLPGGRDTSGDRSGHSVCGRNVTSTAPGTVFDLIPAYDRAWCSP
jgi:hypothetical protein